MREISVHVQHDHLVVLNIENLSAPAPGAFFCYIQGCEKRQMPNAMMTLVDTSRACSIFGLSALWRAGACVQ